MKKKEKRDTQIAIIGAGCRYPGGINNITDLWHFIKSKRDAISDIPPDRWDVDKFYHPNRGIPGKYYTRRGGFIGVPDQFDNDFFGISPREASHMDPQQRLMLEVAWETFEDAGISIDKSIPRSCGVFVGISNFDYAKMQRSLWEMDSIDLHTSTGVSFSISANRISHAFNLTGPSVAIDTACSSSLVALHQACRSIISNECDMALAGGTNLMLSPETFVNFCRLSMLSEDGRCKTFDRDADGFVRAEGAGAVILKSLSKAVEDNDFIYAVITGSGINQDGATPGITVPNGKSQEILIRKVLKDAGVSPKDIGYVEAHGTGTPVGDPIEANTIGKIFGLSRSPDDPCYIGSVKTNIGHLESSSGIAGLHKAMLSVHHRRILPNLHFHNPNGKIHFDRYNLRVPTEIIPWSPKDRPMACVNSFGYGGTNATVLLKEYSGREHPAPSKGSGTKPSVFILSAASVDSLEALSQRCLEFLKKKTWESFDIAEISNFSRVRRSHLAHRISIVAGSTGELRQKLEKILNHETTTGIHRYRKESGTPGKIALVFGGQGPQWWKMGRTLMESEPVFHNTIGDCDRILKKFSRWSLWEELHREKSDSRLHLTSIAQPAIFAIQAALANLWKHWGIEADGVVGHSVGEVAAAHYAGILSLEDALRVIYHRGASMEHASGQNGEMLAAAVSSEEVAPYLEKYQGEISIGAVNGPQSVTLTGNKHTILKLEQELLDNSIFCRVLNTNYAFHSSHMEGVREKLLDQLTGITTRRPRCRIYSTVSGKSCQKGDFGTEYWWQNVRKPVLFFTAVSNLLKNRFETFLEIGPHPVLSYSISESMARFNRKGTVIHSLSKKEPELSTMIHSAAVLHNLGYRLNWNEIASGPCRKIPFPSYPWNHQSHWFQTPQNRDYLSGKNEHPLLGRRIPSPVPCWECNPNDGRLDYLSDHVIGNSPVFPASAFIEMGFAASQEVLHQSFPVLEDIRFHEMLYFKKPGTVIITVFQPEQSSLRIYSGEKTPEDSWTLHASMTLSPSPGKAQKNKIPSLPELSPPVNIMSKETTYSIFDNGGIHYGSRFRGIREITRNRTESLATISLTGKKSRSSGYMFYPALLDACFQTIIGNIANSSGGIHLPASIDRLAAYTGFPNTVMSHVHHFKQMKGMVQTSLGIYDKTGNKLMGIENFTLHSIGKEQHLLNLDQLNYQYHWVQSPHPDVPEEISAARSQVWIIFTGHHRQKEQISAPFLKRDGHCFFITPGNKFKKTGDHSYSVRPGSDSHVNRALDDILNETKKRNIHGILYLWGMDTSGIPENDKEILSGVYEVNFYGLLALSRYLNRWDTAPRPPVWVITRGARPPGIKAMANPVQTAIWGMCRVIRNESPGTRLNCIDFSPTIRNRKQVAGEFRLLYRETTINSEENEIAFRGGKRYVHRFKLKETAAGIPALPDRGKQSRPFQLIQSRTGMMKNLIFRQIKRNRPKSRHVEIEVNCGSLNFSDVLKALNLYPGQPDDLPLLGIDCAGTVTRVAHDVKEFRPGDRVMGLCPGALASHAVTRAEFLVKIPKKLSFAEAAAIPLAFLTAYHALVTLGNLKAGERVLIHSATGGVGLAAIQIARSIGARVFTTAGSREKRKYLRSIGIKHVYDSHSLEFAREITEDTKREGVDMVLNSLSGMAISKGLSILKGNGRFIEIGKTDIYKNTPVGLSLFKKNISFFVLDIDRFMREKPQEIKNTLQKVVDRFADNRFSPLSSTQFPLSKAEDGFRLMSQARHIGKIVFEISGSVTPVIESQRKSFKPDPEKTYLVTGGFGGVGLHVIEWLVNKGARHIAVFSRSGAKSKNALEMINGLKDKGVNIHAITGDISMPKDTEALQQYLHRNMPPLRGIFHAAMVLQDSTILNLSPGKMEKVLDPKIAGTLNLHKMSASLKLDSFVLFSSVTPLLGMPGQANYAAANAFMDGFSHYRRSLGLPASAINWGYIKKSGVAARSRKITGHFNRLGIRGLHPDTIGEVLSRTLDLSETRRTVMDINWEVLSDHFTSIARSPVFSESLFKPVDTDRKKTEERQSSDPKGTTPEDMRKDLEKAFLKQVAKILGTDGAGIVPGESLVNLGFDSLMGVELRNWIEEQFKITLPTGDIMSGTSIKELVDTTIKKYVTAGNDETG